LAGAIFFAVDAFIVTEKFHGTLACSGTMASGTADPSLICDRTPVK